MGEGVTNIYVFGTSSSPKIFGNYRIDPSILCNTREFHRMESLTDNELLFFFL